METPELDVYRESLEEDCILCDKKIVDGQIYLNVSHKQIDLFRFKVDFSAYKSGPLATEKEAIEELRRIVNSIRNDFSLLLVTITNQYEQVFCR